MTTSTEPVRQTAPFPNLYTGPNARCADARQAAVLLENSTISRAVYRPGTVDFVMFDDGVVLQQETAGYLYSKFTPLDRPYLAGTRVFLEKIVGQLLTQGCGVFYFAK